MNIAKNFILYSAGTILVKTLLWIAAPIALYTVSAEIMGLWSLCNAFIAIGAVFMALGLRQVFFIEYFHKSPHERRIMINELLMLYTLYAIPIIAVLWMYRGGINAYFFAGAASDILILLCLSACFLSFFTELLYQVLLYSRKIKLLLGIQIGGAFITAIGSLISIYLCKVVVLGLLVSLVSGLLFVCIIAFLLYIKKNVFLFYAPLSLAKVRFYFFQGLPFIPSVLSFWLLSSANRWLLATYTQLQDVGIYSAAEMVSMLFQMVVLYPLSGAYLPIVMESFSHNKNEHARIDAQNKTYMHRTMFVLIIGGTTLFFITKPWLYTLLPASYQLIVPYLIFVGIGNVFLMGTYFTNCYIQYRKKTLFLAGSLMLCALVNMGISYFLIFAYGVAGCIIASLCAYMVYFFITYRYNSRLHLK